MVYVFLADGFEECEALAPVDILRRGGVTVKTVGVGGKTVTGAHGIPVVCDREEAEIAGLPEAVVLPGGMPGTLNLEKSETVQAVLQAAFEKGALIGAICAAPSILGHKGFLQGRKATCFPGFESARAGADVLDEPVVEDGNIITSYGAGAAFDFGFALLAALKGKACAEELRKGMKYNKAEK